MQAEVLDLLLIALACGLVLGVRKVRAVVEARRPDWTKEGLGELRS